MHRLGTWINWIIYRFFRGIGQIKYWLVVRILCRSFFCIITLSTNISLVAETVTVNIMQGNYGHFQICRLRTTTAHSDYEWFVHTRTRCKYIRNRLGINRSLQRIAIMNTSRLRSILLIVTMSNFAHSDYEQFCSWRPGVILLIVTMSDFAHIDYEWFCS
jgi:hypothetical protein